MGPVSERGVHRGDGRRDRGRQRCLTAAHLPPLRKPRGAARRDGAPPRRSERLPARFVASRELPPVEGLEALLRPVAAVRAPDPPGGPRAGSGGHHGRRGRGRVARPDGRHPRGLPARGRADRGRGAAGRGWTVDTAADWIHAPATSRPGSTWSPIAGGRRRATSSARSLRSWPRWSPLPMTNNDRAKVHTRVGDVPRRRRCPLDPGPIVCPAETGSGPPGSNGRAIWAFVAGGNVGLVRPLPEVLDGHVCKVRCRAAHLHRPAVGTVQPAVEPL